MDSVQLLDLTARSRQVKTLSAALTSQSGNVCVEGLMASSMPLFFASIINARRSKNKSLKAKETATDTLQDVTDCLHSGDVDGGCLLFILDDEETAAYFYHDMVQMLGDGRVLYYPSSYRRAIKYNQRDDANIILRTEVLARVETANIDAVVTYPDAIAERVISKETLTANSVTLTVGESHDVTELEQRLFELGFSRVDYVYEVGQFAIRGSIVDIYSYGNELPLRIDFFGDEIDSIRTFDIQSQLSIEKMKTVAVVANSSQGTGGSFLDFLRSDTILVASDIQFVADRIEQIHNEGFSRQAIIEGKDVEDKDGLIDGENFLKSANGHRVVEYASTGNKGKKVKSLTFNISPQPLFHKNFDLLIDQLQHYWLDGYRILIFADNDKQTARLREIIDNHSGGKETEQIEWTSVPKAIHEGFIDNDSKICFLTDHQIFDRYHKYSLKSDKVRKGKIALSLKEIRQFEIGDFIVHIDHGVGRFAGLVRVPTNNGMQEMIKLEYQNNDVVYVSIHALHKVSKYKGKDGEAPRLNRIGTGAWERMKERVKTKMKDIARELIQLYAQRLQKPGFAFTPDTYLQQELEASFIYEDTPDQLKATHDVKADMEQSRPMDRLVCGDVGFGKTEVAIRAAFKAATDGKQVAVLVPTTILAYQHYKTFSERLKDFPVRVDYLSRARTAKQTTELLKDLASGKIDIIVGTHKLIGKDVRFHDLGLLVIDEEQKFGVAVKEKLRQMKVDVDTLTMTATPIPRTLQFSLMGARDLSVIQTPPANRYPIQTEIHTFSAAIIAEAINFEMSRNGQVFFVNNRINNLIELKALIEREVPDARVCIGHGQMPPKDLEKIVFDFMNYDYDVLLSTTIVENGVDIPNANTIIINNAHNYGLSDLHQMRGRVGRSNKKAFCYLLAPPLALLKDDARRRLQALENFSDLGSGIHIAMQDLDIRGAGNLLGAEQSGFIADLGYETYQKVLNEAITELRETEFHDIFDQQNDEDDKPQTTKQYVAECNVETDIVAYFPDEYVPTSAERMNLYRELDSIADQQTLDTYKARLVDRFGEIPELAEELIKIMPLKWTACTLGIEKVMLKGGNMTLFLVSDNNSSYYSSPIVTKILTYISNNQRTTQLRNEQRRSLVIKGVHSISKALQDLTEIAK